MRLYDTTGRMVRQVDGRSHIDVRDLPSGNYTLVLYTEEGQVISTKVQKH